MYGVLCDKNLIAIHDDINVVRQFLRDQKNIKFNIIKIKKEYKKKIKKDTRYTDLYLVRYGDSYIPYELMSTFKRMTDQYNYDLNYCKDILFRLLEDPKRTKKETEHIQQTISILLDEIQSNSHIDISLLKNGKELDELYRGRMVL